MKFTGIITNIGQTTTGTSAKGDWCKVEFVVQEIGQQYPQTACFTLFGDKVQQYASCLVINAVVTVQFDIKCREHDGRFYNSINAWSVAFATPATGTQQAQPQQVQPQPQPMQSPAPTMLYAQQPVQSQQPVENLPF